MSQLHLLNKAADHPRFSQCLDQSDAGDSIALSESGVLALALGVAWPEGVHLYALSNDLEARGLKSSELPDHVSIIGYEQLVELTLSTDKVVCW
ncbi:sulfurtransferase complex subunit TusB [Marinobacter sp. 1Y8]